MEAALCVLESKQVVGQPVNITSIKYTCFPATAIVSCIRLFASQLFTRFDITLIFLLVTELLIDPSSRFKNFDTKINQDRKDSLFLVADRAGAKNRIYSLDPRSPVSAAE